MLNLLFLIASLFIVIKSSDFAVKYATSLAKILRLPKYVVGFLIVAIISIMPETFISIDSSIRGIPEFGLGTLFGSNVADLTLIFAIVIFSTAHNIKVGSRVLENNKWYPLLLALPILIGFDGHYSRIEGVILILAGLSFYYFIFKKNRHAAIEEVVYDKRHHIINLLYLILSVAFLLFGSHFTVKYGVALAGNLNINPIFIAMLVVGLGTTLPELFFSLRATKEKADNLALGDVLGTVISDATIAVGIIALINPFYFPQRIVYITAMFMVLASLILLAFMRSGKVLTKREGILLFIFYIIFVLTEYLIGEQVYAIF